MSALTGKRILLVEDEFIIATMAADMLTELGATVVGPADTIVTGLHLAETGTIDAAVLDVNMGGDRIDPVAEVLSARGIPSFLRRATATALPRAHTKRSSSTSLTRRSSSPTRSYAR